MFLLFTWNLNLLEMFSLLLSSFYSILFSVYFPFCWNVNYWIFFSFLLEHEQQHFFGFALAFFFSFLLEEFELLLLDFISFLLAFFSFFLLDFFSFVLGSLFSFLEPGFDSSSFLCTLDGGSPSESESSHSSFQVGISDADLQILPQTFGPIL